MTLRATVFVSSAILLLAACQTPPSNSDGGTPRDAGSSDAGTSDGGDNVVSSAALDGWTAFLARSAYASFGRNIDGSVNKSDLSVTVNNLSLADFCTYLQGNEQAPASQDVQLVTVLVQAADPTATLGLGSFDILPYGASPGARAEFGYLSQGYTPAGTRDAFVSIGKSGTGTIDVASITWPIVLADGGRQGGEVQASFATTLALSDGGAASIAGVFDATPGGCP